MLPTYRAVIPEVSETHGNLLEMTNLQLLPDLLSWKFWDGAQGSGFTKPPGHLTQAKLKKHCLK